MSTLNNDFENVLRDLKKRLTERELEDFESTNLQHVQATMQRIQNAQHVTLSNLNMKRLQSFLEAMDQFGEVIEVFLNVNNAVAFIWGPLKFMLQVASSWADSFETLLDAYEQIGEHIPLLKQYRSLFEEHPETRKVLCLIYQDVLEFHSKALRFFSTKVWRQVFRSCWGDFNTRFRSILDRLSRHKRLLAEQAQAAFLARSQQHQTVVLQHIRQYDTDRELVQKKLDELAVQFTSERDLQKERSLDQERFNADRQRNAVMEWLAASQTLTLDHESYQSIRNSTKADGKWILRDSQMQNWLEEDPPVFSMLWLCGIPGAGKTILASTVIDHCISQPGHVTAYFYCRKDDPERNTCLSVCRALLSQILRTNRDLLGLFDRKRTSSGEVVLNSNTLAEQVLKLICNYLVGLTIDVRLIIDGIDECEDPERKTILTLLTQIVAECDSQHPGKLRLLVVSQAFDDIKRLMTARESLAEILELNSKHISGDLCLYVSQEAKSLSSKFELLPDQVDELIRMTCARADGMFLFAKLLMDHLKQQVTTQAFCDAVRDTTFPTGLRDIYGRIIAQIRVSVGEEAFKFSRHLFGWLLCAKRPLKWPEIQAAMSVDVSSTTMDMKGRKLRKEIHELCGSLVTISKDERIELIHSTAKQYISDSEDIDLIAIECDLTTLIFRYLVFPCFEANVEEEKLKMYVREGYLGFQDYAISNWFGHVKSIIDLGSKLSSDEDASSNASVGLVDAAEDFMNTYPESFEFDNHPDAILRTCEDLKGSQLYDYVLDLWTHIQKHVQKGPSSRNEISITTLASAVARNRQCLEDLSSAVDIDTETQELYGDNLFKCPKLSCFCFYNGFSDGKRRDQHIRQHERPFQCEVPSCTISEFGFTTNSDLEKHMRNFHPQDGDLRELFFVRRPDTQSRWACQLCNRTFTRNFHLKNHQLSHAGERPHVCPECGKAFTRSNDCKRHEKIHARR